MKKQNKVMGLSLIIVLALVVLSACGQSGQAQPISSESEGLWDGVILYSFSRVIIWISETLGGNYGLGIILFTLLVRVILIPLSIYQMKSMRKMSDVNPKLQALKEEYDTTDKDQMEAFNEETARLYEEHGVNPYASCLPLLIQTPILIALYQAISRTPVIAQQSFLWVNLGEPDPYFILPLLAALFAWVNSKLTTMATANQPSMAVMTYTMPILIFLISFPLASAISLYFVVSNAFMVVQTLVINNPFQLQREREEEEARERQAELDRKRAIKKAKKTKRSIKK